MAREKKKVDQSTGVRPGDEAAVAEFSGLMAEDAPPPSVPADSKGRGAGKGAASPPAPAKPRPRKQPVATTDIIAVAVPPIPAPPPPSKEVTEPADDFSLKAREAGALLDALGQQCREARTQLQGEMEERKSVEREAEALRERSKAAHEQLIRKAEEARTVHQQLLSQTREGAEQVKRELTTVAAQMAAAGREADKLFQEFAEGVTLLNRECAVASQKVAEAGAEFAEVRRVCFEGFAQEVGLLHQNLREVGQSMQDLPRQAEAFRLRLAEAREEGRAFEEEAAAARRNLESVEDETQRANLHLAALRAEVAEAEGRLAALRLEPKEDRRQPEPAKPAHETIVEDAPPPTPEPEPRNHLGIAVDPGVVVAEVAPGTPAAVAGLIRGDVITAINGTSVLSGPELRELILAEEDGEELVFSLMRGGLGTEARVRFEVGGEKPSENQLGATVEEGVVVAEVAPGTPGAFAGLIHGDVITSVNSEAVYTGAQLRDAVHALEGRSEVTIRFTRSGEAHEVKTRLEEVTATPQA